MRAIVAGLRNGPPPSRPSAMPVPPMSAERPPIGWDWNVACARAGASHASPATTSAAATAPARSRGLGDLREAASSHSGLHVSAGAVGG